MTSLGLTTTGRGPTFHGVHTIECPDCGGGVFRFCARCESGFLCIDIEDCGCDECADAYEQAGVDCGCGKCAACGVLRCNALGPVTLNQHLTAKALELDLEDVLAESAAFFADSVPA